MAHLTLAGLSGDGKRLLLVSDKGVEFTLDVDERLRAALRGDHTRLGQLEIKMDSVLRPRDIQARIRSGETPEAVAQAAQTSLDAIMPFAAPVLAERQHVAQRAQRSSVRRTGQAGGARTLGDAVGAHLRGRNVDPETVDWDSARREDGKWTLTAEFSAGSRSGVAKFVFDAPGNYVVVDNEDATWLVGDTVAPATATPEPVGDDISRARARRAASAGEEQLPLGDDAISLVTDGPDSLGSEQPVEAFLDDEPASGDALSELEDAEQASTESAEQPVEAVDTTDTHEPADEPAPKPAKKRGRSSVPSWDEIMFGGGGGKSE